MALDQVSFEAALKQLYPSEAIKNLVYMNNPAYALIPKDETFGGESSKEHYFYHQSILTYSR